MGSKNKIAEKIIDFLPKGKRFVDLFGGGGAMSHCAMLSGKYEQVLYNELNQSVAQLFRDATAGKFSKNKFIPRWISREEFNAKKETDGYIRTCWSFGNNGRDYIFHKEIESIKKQGFEYCVNKRSIDGVPDCDFDDIHDRRIFLARWARIQSLQNLEKLQSLQNLERLQSLQNLEKLQSLQNLERLEKLEITNESCLSYKYKAGDVVYCDPPYENTHQYTEDEFDHKVFYDWVANADFPIWFSSYDISDRRFLVVWKTLKRSLLDYRAGLGKNKIKTEYIYANKKAQMLSQQIPMQSEFKFVC